MRDTSGFGDSKAKRSKTKTSFQDVLVKQKLEAIERCLGLCGQGAPRVDKLPHMEQRLRRLELRFEVTKRVRAQAGESLDSRLMKLLQDGLARLPELEELVARSLNSEILQVTPVLLGLLIAEAEQDCRP